MKISFLVIASEILEGKVQDLNTLNLSKFLKSHNQTLQQVITVGDRPQQIVRALGLLAASDLVIISGGLGPTPDDLTKTTLADYFNQSLAASEESIAIAHKNFENQGRPFPPGHPYQLIPGNSTALFNPEGLAPGLLFSLPSSTFIALPGVPREFKSMMEMHLPRLLPQVGDYLEDYLIRTKGIGEQKIFNELDPELWNKLCSYGAVASLPYLYGVDITIRLSASSATELLNQKQKLAAFIQSHPLQQFIWHIGPETLEECIVNKAKELNVRFGFAESCTGGLCSDRITNINGSSSVFYGSLICYDSEIKVNQLHVDPQLIQQFDVVSLAVAKQMAQGLRLLYPLDIAISLTGYAGPHDKEQQIPIGTVCIGISSCLGDFSYQYHFRGERLRLKENFCQVALFQLLETLEKLALR